MRRPMTPKPDTEIHRVGQEQFTPVEVTKYDGDLPTGEPNDWFIQSDELIPYPFDEYDGYELDDKYLWDEW